MSWTIVWLRMQKKRTGPGDKTKHKGKQDHFSVNAASDFTQYLNPIQHPFIYSQEDNWTVCRSGMYLLHNAFVTFTKGPSATVYLALCVCLH